MASKICGVDGCGKLSGSHSVCAMHRRRLARNGHYGLQDRPNRRADGSGAVTAAGYVSHSNRGNRKYEHVLVAEKALGKPLPPGAQVHHVNEDPLDNRPENLVVCVNDAYHKLLHKRSRALTACGNANWLICCFCQKYDDPVALVLRGKMQFHRDCERSYNRNRYAKRKLVEPPQNN